MSLRANARAYVADVGRFAGLAVALPALPWVWNAAVRASWAPLGRDQGIFQYVAWAVSNGAIAYRDVRDVNGPLVILVHTVFQALGGAEDHRFRVLDLLLVAATSAIAGASLPFLERRGERAAAGAGACALILTQYLAYGFWDTAQRETFFDAFVLVSMAAQWRAQGRWRARAGPDRRAAILCAIAGAASAAPLLGKPTYALMTAGQIAVLLVDDVPVHRLRRLAIFAAGGLAGLLVPFAFLAARGDVGAWAAITFRDVPAMYRFIWPRTTVELLKMWRDPSLLAGAASALVLALVVLGRGRWLERRALTLATFPLAALGSALVQAKGFPYHFQPVTLGAWLALFAVVLRASRASRVPIAAGGVVLALALGIDTAGRARASPWPDPPDTEASLEEKLGPFVRVDYFPFALREVARDLDDALAPDETVQVYGMDPYVLFLARRRSATPYIYAYDLNADAALHGSFDEGGPRPNAAEAARIRAMRDAHERDLLERVTRAPPGAFVFMDRSPLMNQDDALADFEAHCPTVAAWMRERYEERFEHERIHVWLKRAPAPDR